MVHTHAFVVTIMVTITIAILAMVPGMRVIRGLEIIVVEARSGEAGTRSVSTADVERAVATTAVAVHGRC